VLLVVDVMTTRASLHAAAHAAPRPRRGACAGVAGPAPTSPATDTVADNPAMFHIVRRAMSPPTPANEIRRAANTLARGSWATAACP
jgi:hypothetical protein